MLFIIHSVSHSHSFWGYIPWGYASLNAVHSRSLYSINVSPERGVMTLNSLLADSSSSRPAQSTVAVSPSLSPSQSSSCPSGNVSSDWRALRARNRSCRSTSRCWYRRSKVMKGGPFGVPGGGVLGGGGTGCLRGEGGAPIVV